VKNCASASNPPKAKIEFSGVRTAISFIQTIQTLIALVVLIAEKEMRALSFNMLQDSDYSNREFDLITECKAWLDFGLPREAIIALDELPKRSRNTFSVLELKWQAYFLLRQFDDLKKIGAILTKYCKENVQAWLLYAQSYHATAEYGMALKILQPMEKKFCDCWNFAYDYACYHALTGDFPTTGYWLDIAKKHGNLEKIKKLISKDLDLKKYREYLRKNKS